MYVVRGALYCPTLAMGVCTVDIEPSKPSGNPVLDKLLAGSVRAPWGTLYNTDYRTTEDDARAAIRDMIAKDRDSFRAALAKLDEFETELNSGAPLFATHIDPL